MTRSTNGIYNPVWEMYSDWDRFALDNFTLCNIDISWEAGYFTFHFALLGLHVGRSVELI